MRVRLATWNIHGGVGMDRRYSPERIARVIEELDADIVALQEFGSRGSARDLRSHLEEVAGSRLVVQPTFVRDGCDFGNAVMTRLPLLASAAHDLSHGRREPRNAIEATVDAGGHPLRVLATHLGLASLERRGQIERLHALIDAATDVPTAIVGDLNEWRRGNLLADLHRRYHALPAPATFPSPFAVAPLDRIFVAPAGLCSTLAPHKSRLARIASDHLPLVATIDLP